MPKNPSSLPSMVMFAIIGPGLAAMSYCLIVMLDMKGISALRPSSLGAEWRDLVTQTLGHLEDAYKWGALPSLIFGRLAAALCDRGFRPSNVFLLNGALAFVGSTLAVGDLATLDGWQVGLAAGLAIGVLSSVAANVRYRC